MSFDGNEHTKSVTFEKAVACKMWIKRGADAAIEQTDRSVTVANGNMIKIKMSIAVLIGLLLF